MTQHYKYPDISRLGHDDNRELLLYGDDDIVIEEKVDGGNGSFWIDEETGIMYEASRNRNLILEEDDKTFIRERLWLRANLKAELNPDYIYYIEWMQQHTIRYLASINVIGFDIRLKRSKDSEELGLFLGREAREQEFKRLGIENVPMIWRGKVSELKKMEIEDLIGESKYGKIKMEGIVIKNMTRKSPHGNHQLYAKLVTSEFKECNRAVFGGLKIKASDTLKIVDEYATDSRIRKMLLKLTTEEGMKLDRPLMKVLPVRIIKDILKEEFNSIYDNYRFIDFKEMKSLVPKKCLRVIDEEMMKNSLGGKQ